MNNYQAGSYLLSALSIPFDETFVKELAATLSEGQDGYRTTDTPSIPAMEGEPYMVPPAHMLADRMGQFYAFLADVRVHPLIKAAVGQAYILATRPFQEANERLGRLISNAVLLRYGYDFFLDISISAFIARESYRYFKAMREIIRSDNDGDLTYFVEYYLELLVRALDGTRMEEAERLQSQLESERKMALQPLKQPTVQYTQPHNYSAEAVARVIDNAESGQEAEEGADVPPGERSQERTHTANDGIDGTAPDPPELPDGNASYRSSQSQAGSTQGDRKGAQSDQAQMKTDTPRGRAVVTQDFPRGACPHNEPEAGDKKMPSSKGRADTAQHNNSALPEGFGTCSYDYACPQLLGLPKTLMTRIGEMLEGGISPFLSAQWAETFGLTAKEAAMECRALSIQKLVDRSYADQIYRYTFRFSREEFDSAMSAITASIRSEDGEKILETIERSGTAYNRKAVEFIRNCCFEESDSFYSSQLQGWCNLSQADTKVAMTVLEERGIINRPGKGKYTIVMPSPKNSRKHSEGELLQAVVASQEQKDMQIPAGLATKLAELACSSSVVERRIAQYLPQFICEGRTRLRFTDWMEVTKMSDSVSASDLTVLESLGLAKKTKPADGHSPIVYDLILDPESAVNWDDLSLTTRKVLDGIVRAFGTNAFTLQMLEPVTGISAKNMAIYMKALRLRSIVKTANHKHRGKIYSLAVPVEEAVEHLREFGFDYIALVG
jgi:predicted transcriptional regulator